MTLQLSEVCKSFRTGSNTVEVLRGISFELKPGQSLAVMGPSGSGKSTLLHLIGTLDSPSSGSILMDGGNPFALSEPDLAKFRNRQIGFVFQDHHLLPQYSVLENVLIPTTAFPGNTDDLDTHARDLLERVGLSHRLHHLPAELSGGERQRAAIARALIQQPGILLCDEPTGNLDRSTANSVADLLLDLHRKEQTILIVATHSIALAGRFQLRFELNEGKLQQQT